MYGPQSRYPVPFYVTRPRARVLTWTELEHVGFDPAPFDLGGFSSQYRLPIICPTFDDRGYLSKISYKPIFLPIFRSRFAIYHKMEGFSRGFTWPSNWWFLLLKFLESF